MRIDWYTKLVLTVIAVCLVWIALGGSSTAQAQARTQAKVDWAASGGDHVVLVGWRDSSGQIFHFQPPPAGTVPSGLPVQSR